MIYFLVNNNHHAVDFVGHLTSLRGRDVTLIEIPHSLDPVSGAHIARVHRFLRARRAGLSSQVWNYLVNARRIRRAICPTAADVLFLYTEYEILNQYVAGRFRSVGARVYLLEDGGLGTYVPFRMEHTEPLILRERIKAFIYRRLPGLGQLQTRKFNGHVFYWMPDSAIDGLCLYRRIAIRRNIAPILLQYPDCDPVESVPGRTVFLNEPLYGIYMSSEEFLAGLRALLEALVLKFTEVLFKFHPREDAQWRERITREVLQKMPAIRMIDEDRAIEATADRYRPAVLSSFFCSALLALAERGVEPLYLYHLVPVLERQPVAVEVTNVLMDLRYNFATDLESLDPGYRSGLVARPDDPEARLLGDVAAG